MDDALAHVALGEDAEVRDNLNWVHATFRMEARGCYRLEAESKEDKAVSSILPSSSLTHSKHFYLNLTSSNRFYPSIYVYNLAKAKLKLKIFLAVRTN
jgi:hypothetical protein